MWRGRPHALNVLQLPRPQRVLGITMQCKHASQIEKPREGTGLSGPYRVNEFGNYAKAGITTPCVNKGDNSRILVQCDIGATEAGTEADLIPLCEQGWQLPMLLAMRRASSSVSTFAM